MAVRQVSLCIHNESSCGRWWSCSRVKRLRATLDPGRSPVKLQAPARRGRVATMGKKAQRPMKGFSKITFGDDPDEGGKAVACPMCGALACFCKRDLATATPAAAPPLACEAAAAPSLSSIVGTPTAEELKAARKAEKKAKRKAQGDSACAPCSTTPVAATTTEEKKAARKAEKKAKRKARREAEKLTETNGAPRKKAKTESHAAGERRCQHHAEACDLHASRPRLVATRFCSTFSYVPVRRGRSGRSFSSRAAHGGGVGGDARDDEC